LKLRSRFRWVACQIDHLCELNNDRDRRNALDTLPPTLHATYERILARVNASNPGNQRLVQNALRWIICAEEPLSTQALLEALAINEDETHLDRNCITTEDELLWWCSSLVRRKPGGGGIELAHFTVKEFFQTIDPTNESEFSKYGIGIGAGQIQLARTCLAYLNLKDFEIHPPDDNTAYNLLEKRYAFLAYAVKYWAYHANNHFANEYVESSAQLLFAPSKTKQFILWTQLYLRQIRSKDPDDLDDPDDSEDPDDLEDPKGSQVLKFLDSAPIHWAACLGLDKLCEWLLTQGADVNKASSLGTPLNCALNSGDVFIQGRWQLDRKQYHKIQWCWQSRARAIRLLLKSGAIVDRKIDPSSDKLPLQTALEAFDTDEASLFRLMLDAGAKITKPMVEYMQKEIRPGQIPDSIQAILSCVKDQDVEIDAQELFLQFRQSVELFHGINFEDLIKYLPLIAMMGQLEGATTILSKIKEMTKLIKTAEFSQEIKKKMRAAIQGAIVEAIKWAQVDLVEFFLSEHDTINQIDDDGNKLLHLSLLETKHGTSVGLASLLIKHGADVSAINKVGQSSLHLAAQQKFPEILELLLQHITKRDTLFTKTLLGLTPLWCAIDTGSDSVAMRLLEEYSSNEIRQQTYNGRSLLQLSTHRASTEVLKKLMEMGMGINEMTSDGRTTLHYATSDEVSVANFQFLLGQATDLSIRQKDGLATIHLLSRDHEKTAVDKLRAMMSAGANVNEQSAGGKTPLFYTAGEGLGVWNDVRIQHMETLLNNDLVDVNARDHNGCTPLMACLKHICPGDPTYSDRKVRAVKMLIWHGADVKLKNIHGEAALHLACLQAPTAGSLTILEHLLAEGLGFDTKCDDGLSGFARILQAMKDAIKAENSQDKGALWAAFEPIATFAISCMSVEELHKPLTSGLQPLSFAIRENYDIVTTLLLDKGVEVDKSDVDGLKKTPLEMACLYGCSSENAEAIVTKSQRKLDESELHADALIHLSSRKPEGFQVLKQILKLSVNVDSPNRDGHTALMIAVQGGCTSSLRSLLAKKANVELKDPVAGLTALHWAAKCGSDIATAALIEAGSGLETRCHSGLTPLILAACEQKWTCVQVLADSGADLSAKSIDGDALIHFAAQSGSIETLKFLVAHLGQGDIDARAGEKSGHQTSLHMAAETGNAECFEFLLQSGASISLKCRTGSTAHCAMMASTNDVRQILLSHNIDWSDASGCLKIREDGEVHNNMPLHLAAATGNDTAIKFLIEFDNVTDIDAFADPNLRFTALHLATIQGHRSTMELLIRHGAQVGIADKAGRTSLHHAARLGFAEIVEVLLSKDADPNVTDLHGATPASLAMENNHRDLAQLIARHHTAETGDAFGLDPLLQNPAFAIQIDCCEPADLPHLQSIIDGGATLYAIDLGLCHPSVRTTLQSHHGRGLQYLGKPVLCGVSIKMSDIFDDILLESASGSPKPEPSRTEWGGEPTNSETGAVPKVAVGGNSVVPVADCNKVVISFCVPNTNTHQESVQ
jgi:ankyrin repeat protein